jgi:hypothetical protein
MLRTIVTTGLGGGGVGAATSVLGICPARAVAESAHARVTANTNRFMVFSFEFLRMQDLWQQNKLEQSAKHLASRSEGD